DALHQHQAVPPERQEAPPRAGLRLLAMSVTIARLSTRCTVPRPHEGKARALVERVTGGALASALGERLGGFSSAAPAVVRVRRLRVRIELSAKDLTEEGLARAWAQGLARALARALAAGGDDTVSAQTRSAWIARVIAQAAAGDALARWELAPESP